MKGAFHVQFLILNYVLIQETLHQCVLASRSTGTTRGKSWIYIYIYTHTLDDSGLITDFTGPWEYMLFLALKPHQEDCTDVDNFICKLCVSYRPLTGVTQSFEFPIPRCADIIEELVDSCGNLSIISLESCSGYHKIRVRKCDQEKLAFSLQMARRSLTQVYLSAWRMH